MAPFSLDRANLEEQLIFWALALHYPVYIVGGLYVLGSALGWLLLMVFLLRGFLTGGVSSRGALAKISPLVWFWVLGMLTMLVALWVAHIDRQLGTGMAIKSTIGWAKGWALLALFPLLGVILRVRPAVLVRGVSITAASALPFAALGILAYIAGMSGDLYHSPLQAVGGPGEVFHIRLFGMNPETGRPRWQFIGPWAPAAGLMACFYLAIILREQSAFWRRAGIAGALFMVLLSQSRAGLAIFILIPVLSWGIGRLREPWILLLLGLGLPALVLLGEPVYQAGMDAYTQVKESRPGSTRVRAALARIALQRWEYEAPIWGHGIVERGPKIVEYMPIGTHHSWYGLLFVKGIVGLLALALPMALTSVYLLYLAQKSRLAQTGMVLCIIMVSYSFFENLEILSYLYWPALFWLGVSLQPGPPGTKGA